MVSAQNGNNIINLYSKGKDAVLEMVHANVPVMHSEGIRKGWYTHYWNPWKLYIAGKPLGKVPAM